jgi:(p)ppGpp synthase/HD superfamily hydrolase
VETASKVERARTFATERHGDQQYGDGSPYVTHLGQVVAVLERFGFGGDHELVCAAWLHDVVEDTETTADEIEDLFGSRVRALVWAVTNEPGKNRKERALKTYPKIASTPDAIIVKLADRIANVEASIRSRPDLLAMYRKEWAKFASLRSDAGPATMWEHLQSLIETD